MVRSISLMLMSAGLLAACATAPLSQNATGVKDGRFHTFWRDSGFAEMHLGRGGAYSVAWRLGDSGNLVAGTGWAAGSADRVVEYTAYSFDPGANGYLTLYGWSTDPLVEYYVVDSWGGFVPPGANSVLLGSVESDGGAYRIYRTRRINQPSIAGISTFDQFWSVRTSRRPLGGRSVITFANHVAAWEANGLHLGALGYQVLATEGFGSDGSSEVQVWD